MLAITSEASRVPRVEVEPPAAGSSDSSATSFEYPALCSRSRLYFCWVYSAFVLTRTCCLWNSFASSTRPASCSIGPSSRVSSSLSSTTFSRSSSLISPTSCAFASSLPTPASISTPRNQRVGERRLHDRPRRLGEQLRVGQQVAQLARVERARRHRAAQLQQLRLQRARAAAGALLGGFAREDGADLLRALVEFWEQHQYAATHRAKIARASADDEAAPTTRSARLPRRRRGMQNRAHG